MSIVTEKLLMNFFICTMLVAIIHYYLVKNARFNCFGQSTIMLPNNWKLSSQYNKIKSINRLAWLKISEARAIWGIRKLAIDTDTLQANRFGSIQDFCINFEIMGITVLENKFFRKQWNLDCRPNFNQWNFKTWQKCFDPVTGLSAHIDILRIN